MPFKLSRREVLKLFGRLGILFGIFSTVGFSLERFFSGGEPKTAYFRPPGALEEPDFISTCIRCQMCVEACPTKVIKPFELSDGLDIAWTPTMVLPLDVVIQEEDFELASRAVCVGAGGYKSHPDSGIQRDIPQCNLECTKSCPTGALQKIKSEQLKVGTAVIDQTRCLGWITGCEMWCMRTCPQNLQGKPAIVAVDGSIRWEDATKLPLAKPTINPDVCTGCGACIPECYMNSSIGVLKIDPQGAGRTKL